jgi:uncharacterized HAD superfamily protein
MRIRGGSVITDVGIDMDGVIYDFAKVFHAYAQTKMGKELPLPTTWDFYKEWGLTDQQFDEWLVEGVQKAQLFNCDAPMDNTVEGWNLLKENNIKIHLLTHRGSVSYEQTIQWLERFGFYPDSLHFGTNKGILKAFATDECAAIDDYPLYYTQYDRAGVISFLRTQPWNEQVYARRVTDLLDFAKKVVTINEAQKVLIELPVAPKSKSHIIWEPNKNPTSTYTQIYKDTNPHAKKSSKWTWPNDNYR